jgi:hypothetical protein
MRLFILCYGYVEFQLQCLNTIARLLQQLKS